MSPKVHANARKHFGRDRLSDEAILYAYEHALNSRPLDDEDDPRRWLVVGIDQSGRVLELVMLVFDGGGELLIHAMKVRAQFLDELVCLRVATRCGQGDGLRILNQVSLDESGAGSQCTLWCSVLSGRSPVGGRRAPAWYVLMHLLALGAF